MYGEVTEAEKMHTLRVILVRPDGRVEHNVYLDLKNASVSDRYGKIRLKVQGNMTETNFRRALLISDGSPKIFFSSVYCWIFIALIVVVIIGILRGKMKETKNAKVEQ